MVIEIQVGTTIYCCQCSRCMRVILSLQDICCSLIRAKIDRNHIDDLAIPEKLKEYLREYYRPIPFQLLPEKKIALQ